MDCPPSDRPTARSRGRCRSSFSPFDFFGDELGDEVDVDDRHAVAVPGDAPGAAQAQREHVPADGVDAHDVVRIAADADAVAVEADVDRAAGLIPDVQIEAHRAPV